MSKTSKYLAVFEVEQQPHGNDITMTTIQPCAGWLRRSLVKLLSRQTRCSHKTAELDIPVIVAPNAISDLLCNDPGMAELKRAASLHLVVVRRDSGSQLAEAL